MINFADYDPFLHQLVGRRGDDGYRLYLESLRWPGGPECPRCDSRRLLWLDRRHKHHCRDCGYQFRVTAGTLFHSSHLSLGRWLEAVALLVTADDGRPATELQARLGGSYKTAWFLAHRIRAALGATAGDATANADQLATRIRRAYRNTSPKYVDAYRGEMHWRLAEGGDGRAFRSTVRALLQHPPLPYDLLAAGGTE